MNLPTFSKLVKNSSLFSPKYLMYSLGFFLRKHQIHVFQNSLSKAKGLKQNQQIDNVYVSLKLDHDTPMLYFLFFFFRRKFIELLPGF